MEPNRERLRQWTEALRSDKYEQIRGALSWGKNRRCAMGVMYEVAGINCDGNIDGWTAIKVRAWYGANVYTVHDEYGQEQDVATLNDYAGYDFHQIAALIEKEHEL